MTKLEACGPLVSSPIAAREKATGGWTDRPALLSGQWMPAQREDKSKRDQERADGRKHNTDFHDFVFGDQVRGKILEHVQELARARRRVIGSISHVGNLLQRRLINPPAE